MKRVDYKLKGLSNEGCISEINTTAGKRILALTATTSKTFKTWKGAEKFMQARNYIVVNN